MLLKPHRRLEWWLASFTAFYGLWLVALPESLDAQPHVLMWLTMSADHWGTTAALIGTFHLWALWINGRRAWSAHVRAAATVLTAILFAVAFSLLVQAVLRGLAPPTLAIPAHAGFVYASLCAFWVAGRDSYFAICQRRGAGDGA